MSLTDQQYDGYLGALADVEGEQGLRLEAQRQQATCARLERQLHEHDERADRRRRLHDLEVHALHLQISAGEAQQAFVYELRSYEDDLRRAIQDDEWCVCLADPFAEQCPVDGRKG